jgi:hypothetical protein
VEGPPRVHPRIEEVPVVWEDTNIAGSSKPLVLGPGEASALELITEAVDVLAPAGVWEETHRHHAVGMLRVHEAVDILLIVGLDLDFAVFSVVVARKVWPVREGRGFAEPLVEVLAEPVFVAVLLLNPPPQGGRPPFGYVCWGHHFWIQAEVLCRVAVLKRRRHVISCTTYK